MDQNGQIDINNGFIDLALWFDFIQISVFWMNVKQLHFNASLSRDLTFCNVAGWKIYFRLQQIKQILTDSQNSSK